MIWLQLRASKISRRIEHEPVRNAPASHDKIGYERKTTSPRCVWTHTTANGTEDEHFGWAIEYATPVKQPR